MISVITCTIDPLRLELLRSTYALAMGDHPWELVAIRDARSLAEGYTRGIAASRGETVIFCHDDIEILSADFPQRLLRHLERFDLIGVAGTNRLVGGAWTAAGPPHLFGQVAHPDSGGFLNINIYGAPARVIGNIQAVDGLFFAVRREMLGRVAFDPAVFDGFHLYDVDFSFSAYCAGFRLGVACDIQLLHQSLGKYDERWLAYKERFERKWAGRLGKIVPRRFIWAGVLVGSRAEALEVMNPPYWPGE